MNMPSNSVIANYVTQPIQEMPLFFKPDQVTVHACGKVIIVGEHAVVYGAKAVALPVPSLQLTIQIQATGYSQAGGKAALQPEQEGPAYLTDILQEAFQTLNLEPFPLKLWVHSAISIGAGLGSSAALCVGALRALNHFLPEPVSQEEIAFHANKLEKRFHGNPSGLDTAVVSFEKPVYFARGETPQPLLLKEIQVEGKSYPWRFVLIDSEVRASTALMIHQASYFFQQGENLEVIQTFNNLAQHVVRGFADGNVYEVASAMQEAGNLLKQAGVITAPLEEIIHSALGAGCLAAKATGSGGGGCILALLDPLQADRQLAYFKKQFARVEEISIIF